MSATDQSPVILIIDDDDTIRHMLKMMLTRKGCQVIEADCGETGRNILLADPAKIDLVILDLTMPGMSGEETLIALRKIRQDLKVVIASGYDHEDVGSESGEKPNGYLHKPFQMAKLFQVIDEQLA